MILGVGVDTVSLSRFAAKLEQTPRLKERLFLQSETLNDGAQASLNTLAGRFAAKEAVIKALSGASGIEWHGIEITAESSGKPLVRLHGETAKLAERQDVRKLHVSISHDGDSAVAFVVAEGELE